MTRFHCSSSTRSTATSAVIEMRIMPNRQSFARDESGLERKRNRHWPLHRFPVAAEARLAVIADRVMAATFFDRPLSILQCFFLAIPGIDLRLEYTEIIILMISDRLVFT